MKKVTMTKWKKLISYMLVMCICLLTFGGANLVAQYVARDAANDNMVTSGTTRFVTTGGTIEDSNYIYENGAYVLNGVSSAPAPVVTPPVGAYVVFAGWQDGLGNYVTVFAPHTTYYATYKMGQYNYVNSQSKMQLNWIVNTFERGYLFDVMGENGQVATTYRNRGWEHMYKIAGKYNGDIKELMGVKNGVDTATAIQLEDSSVYISVIPSVCSANGTFSTRESNNKYIKISYYIQNRSETPVNGVGLSVYSDIQIGDVDRAEVVCKDSHGNEITRDNISGVTSVSDLGMTDGKGNIFHVKFLDQANVWWGEHLGLHTSKHFCSHFSSDVDSEGYDSAMSFSWDSLNLAGGETIVRSVLYQAGNANSFLDKLENLTLEQPDGFVLNDENQLVNTLIPDEGFECPENILIKVGGNELVKNVDYLYDSSKGTITIINNNIAQDSEIYIEASGVPAAYDFTLDATDTSEDFTAVYAENPAYFQNFDVTLTRSEAGIPKGYEITVMVGENVLSEGYSYKASTGEIKIDAGIINDDVTVVMTKRRHAVDDEGIEKGTRKEASDANEVDGYQAVYVPEKGYRFDNMKVTIDGEEIPFTYNSVNGMLEILPENFTGDVVITADAVKMEYTVTFELENMDYMGETGASPTEDYQVLLVPDEGYIINEELEITSGGETVFAYQIEDNVLTIPAEEIQGNIIVKGYAELVYHSVLLQGANLKLVGANKTTEVEDYEAILEAEQGYDIPDEIKVYVGDQEILGVIYENGRITIPCALVSDTVKIYANAVNNSGEIESEPGETIDDDPETEKPSKPEKEKTTKEEEETEPTIEPVDRDGLLGDAAIRETEPEKKPNDTKDILTGDNDMVLIIFFGIIMIECLLVGSFLMKKKLED